MIEIRSQLQKSLLWPSNLEKFKLTFQDSIVDHAVGLPIIYSLSDSMKIPDQL